GGDRVVHVWDVKSGTCLQRCRGHVEHVRSVAWDPNGRRLASGGADGKVKLWTLSPPPQPRLLEHASWVGAIAWCEDGDTLRSLNFERGVGTITRWDVTDGKRVQTRLDCVCDRGQFSAGGRLVAVSSDADKQPRILICDATSGKPVQTVKSTIPAASWPLPANAHPRAIYSFSSD